MKYADDPMKFLDNEVDLMSLIRGLAQVWTTQALNKQSVLLVTAASDCHSNRRRRPFGLHSITALHQV